MKLTKKWLNEKGACGDGVKWFEAQDETDGVEVLKKLIKEGKLDWANWTICYIFTDEQKRQYAVFSAEQVAYLWKDKYPKEYAIWKKWVDAGCPDGGRDAARDAAWAAAGAARAAAGDAAWDAMMLKILNYGMKLLEG